MAAPDSLPTSNDNASRTKEEDAYRALPHNIDAEQGLLGILLIKNEAIHDIGDFLRPEHFFEPLHARIYGAIEKYIDRGMLANPVTLKPIFDQDEALKELGGASYLAKLAAGAGMLITARDYARSIYDLALKRQLISIGEEVANDAYITDDPDLTAEHQIEQAEQSLFTLATSGSSEAAFQPLSKSVTDSIQRTEQAFRNPGAVSGLTTGFIDMDRLLGGFQPSDLVIIAGRPSMGKTALATTMAYEAANALMQKHEQEGGEKPGSVGMFSLEMSAEQLAGRLIASESGINSSRLRKGELSSDEFTQLVKASNNLHQLPFFIDDTPAISVSALRTRARRMKRRFNLSLLIVDYLQLMRGVSAQAQTNRVQEISEITQGLKAVAKELNIPVIALSQLSRAVEQRDDKRPQLSDLRESGSIEQDADVVMFVFREEYYVARKMPREGTPQFEDWQREMEAVHGLAEVIIAKQRHGPIGTVKLAFHGDTTRFKNYANDDYMPEY